MAGPSCALVSTAGELLIRHDGARIDATEIVARMSQAPTDGYGAHVGTRTSVRFVKQSFFYPHYGNKSALRELARTETPDMVYLVDRWAMCPAHVAQFHVSSASSSRLVCAPNNILCKRSSLAGHTGRMVSGGLMALTHLFWLYACAEVRLYGFEGSNESASYHYWTDGSRHDRQAAGAWYNKSVKMHDFRAEHDWIRDKFGNGAWVVRRAAYLRACDVNETSLLRRAMGRGWYPSFARTNDSGQIWRHHNASSIAAKQGSSGSLAQGHAGHQTPTHHGSYSAHLRLHHRLHHRHRNVSSAGERRDSERNGTYVFALLGRHVDAAQRAAVLAAISTLVSTQPVYPISLMLTDAYRSDAPLHSALADLGVSSEVYVSPISNVSCFGRRRDSAFGAFTDLSFTKFRLWSLTNWEAVLYLDADVAVVRSLDHLLGRLLAEPTLTELRTPSGCARSPPTHTAGASAAGGPSAGPKLPTAERHFNFNTGVWGVRPDARAFESLLGAIQGRGVGHPRFSCITGDQSAANTLFRSSRTFAGLHGGYNLKADKGVESCMRRLHLEPSDVHVVHWSGPIKPPSKMGRPADPTEGAALEQYMRAYRSFLRTTTIDIRT